MHAWRHIPLGKILFCLPLNVACIIFGVFWTWYAVRHAWRYIPLLQGITVWSIIEGFTSKTILHTWQFWLG